MVKLFVVADAAMARHLQSILGADWVVLAGGSMTMGLQFSDVVLCRNWDEHLASHLAERWLEDCVKVRMTGRLVRL